MEIAPPDMPDISPPRRDRPGQGDLGAFSTSIVEFKQDEMKAILTDFDEPGHLAPTGLFLGGTKYMVIQGEPGAVIRGKKVLYTLP
ncbi:hypothetical protein RND71_036495 [Anisodus tanguticus]|uniref:Profilin n=1 Tax=Anisodus tanguticus TaxID=243964 RepID=A0AAE1R1T5_9SOLA|nr:hypothetical protein RND71_036495 [Anisodus tanguticus]